MALFEAAVQDQVARGAGVQDRHVVVDIDDKAPLTASPSEFGGGVVEPEADVVFVGARCVIELIEQHDAELAGAFIGQRDPDDVAQGFARPGAAGEHGPVRVEPERHDIAMRRQRVTPVTATFVLVNVTLRLPMPSG